MKLKRNLLKTLLFCSSTLLLNNTIKAQNVPITFEAGGNGAAWTWTPFENSTNPAIQLVANPSTTGINTSATCAKMTALIAGQPWAGFESLHPGSTPTGLSDLGTFTISASNAIVKMMVYKSVISDVGIKFANATNGSTGELKVANTLINQWEELTFNFSSKIGEVNDQIIFFPDFQARTTDNICYIDNISFNVVTTPTAPMVAAPTPTDLPANVLSLYSNTYTNVSMATWATSWSAATLTDLQIAGNDTKKYSNLNFVGAEPTAVIDATAMNTFNFNLWTPNITAFRIKLVDFGANGIYGGGDDVEQELSFTPTLTSWNTYKIPLANFTALTTKAHIGQIIFSGDPSGTGTAFIDNVYFSYVQPVVPMVAAPIPTIPQSDVISLFSNTYTNVTVDTWHTSWSNATLTNLQIAGNDTKRYSALDFVGVEATGPNSINISAMDFIKLDLWTPNATTFRVKLVDWGADNAYGGGDDKEFEIPVTPTLSTWNSITLPISSFTGLTTKNHISQVIFSALPTGTADVYIDNVFFSTLAAPLSITDNSFNAELKNQTVVLNWKTDNDVNTASYVVEKSIDGKVFNAIGEINSKKVTATYNYQFVDNAYPNSPVTYYRLKQLNINNNIEYSKTVTVVTNISKNIIAPNPATNSITIIREKSNYSKATICNAFGAIVKNIELNTNATTIDISQLPQGIYFVKYNNTDNQQFIKQ